MLINSCKSKADASKSFRIAEVPPILTLVLKRFRINYSSYGKPRADKYNDFIEYPEVLDVAPYMVDPSVSEFPCYPNLCDSLERTR
jgi:ubiquitin carboxyl-terminal hydrolase 36/42